MRNKVGYQPLTEGGCGRCLGVFIVALGYAGVGNAVFVP
jgi:hypothetical protein